MAYLLDTGIILRLANPRDMQHNIVFQAMQVLVRGQEELLISTQNCVEFCNVATRPVANNGLGFSPAESLQLLEREIEPICAVVTEKANIHQELKRLIATYNVIGKQVHDARLVAMMLAWQIESVLTLNDRDFRRFEPEGITIVTPAELIAAL
jgi:predicted nucleic acid-binding protein